VDKTAAKPAALNLRELLQSLAPLAPEELDRIFAERQQQPGKSLVEIIVATRKVKEEPLLRAIGEKLGLPFVRLAEMELDRAVTSTLQPKVVFQHMVVPIKAENGTLRIATCDPFNEAARSAIGWLTNQRVEMALATREEIEKAQKRYYGVGAETLDQMLAAGGVIDIPANERISIGDIDEASQEASVVKFVNQIIAEAKRDRATDIHIEPMEEDLRIRYRIDGVLVQVPVPAVLKRFQASIISRVKVMANMDIAEKRLPQDGAINLRVGGEEVDIRVSTIPSIHGESVSLRLLSRSTMLLGLDRLGMAAEDEKIFRRLIERPHGIILVTGPTGSGKSTTLYACLSTINTIDQRIMTVEDPVENQLTGIIQMQVRPDIELTFARGLRHLLRQDPDVIMIGEVRDLETAEIAVRASLTGHLVFATLHTNDAPSGFTRLIDMGIEPFLITSSVEAIVAQRLLRTLCPVCKTEDKPSEELMERLGGDNEKYQHVKFYRGVGCEECRRTGYQGRTAIYEVMLMSEALRPLVVDRRPAAELKKVAVAHGMRTLRDDGMRKAALGVTSLEEVLRITQEDEAYADE
jgi:type II secretion system protein E